jgi:CheY-like chemotaxis protein
LRFNTKHPEENPSLSNSDDNRLIVIDNLIVDDQSRLTITKRLKQILSISPRDTILIHQDIFTKDLIFKIQKKSGAIDNWMVKKISNNSSNRKDMKMYYPDTKQENLDCTCYETDILLVDDDQDLLETFNIILSSEGYKNIHSFSDTKRALKHFIELKDPYQYRLAIVDIRMPIINGIQLYQILKILNPTLNVVFITALDISDILIGVYPHIPFENIIKKPAEPIDFIKKINDIIYNIHNVPK